MRYADNVELSVKTEIQFQWSLHCLIHEDLLNHMKPYNSKCDL